MNKIVERLQNGIIKENPTFVLMLGMCPTCCYHICDQRTWYGTFHNRCTCYMSNFMISLLRHIIPDRVIRVPAFIVIVASFVTIRTVPGTGDLFKSLLSTWYLYSAYRSKLYHLRKSRVICF